MKTKTAVREPNYDTDTCALVEGPPADAAEFCALWLMAGVKADRLWKVEAYQNPAFRASIDRLEVAFDLEFALASLTFVRMWLNDNHAFLIHLDSAEAESFAVMSRLGFFTLTGNRYQMTIPTGLNIDALKDALLQLVKTEDSDSVLHPGRLVANMTKKMAFEEKSRLDRIEHDQQLAK